MTMLWDMCLFKLDANFHVYESLNLRHVDSNISFILALNPTNLDNLVSVCCQKAYKESY